jgi:hypothetical protein
MQLRTLRHNEQIHPLDSPNPQVSGLHLSVLNRRSYAQHETEKCSGRNIKKAAKAARKKRTIAHLPKKTRTALGKQAAKVARRKRRASR